MSKRMRKLENTLKKLKTDGDKNIMKDFDQYKRKVDQLMLDFTKVLISNKNSSKQLDNAVQETKTLGESVRALGVKVNQLQEMNNNTTQLFNTSLTQVSMDSTNMTAQIINNQNMLAQVAQLVANLNNTVLTQAITIERQAVQIRDLEILLNITTTGTTVTP